MGHSDGGRDRRRDGRTDGRKRRRETFRYLNLRGTAGARPRRAGKSLGSKGNLMIREGVLCGQIQAAPPGWLAGPGTKRGLCPFGLYGDSVGKLCKWAVACEGRNNGRTDRRMDGPSGMDAATTHSLTQSVGTEPPFSDDDVDCIAWFIILWKSPKMIYGDLFD